MCDECEVWESEGETSCQLQPTLIKKAARELPGLMSPSDRQITINRTYAFK
jgi:hypothetical protein